MATEEECEVLVATLRREYVNSALANTVADLITDQSATISRLIAEVGRKDAEIAALRIASSGVRQVVCGTCRGNGAYTNGPYPATKCNSCGGKGFVIRAALLVLTAEEQKP